MSLTEKQRLDVVIDVIVGETSCNPNDLFDGHTHVLERGEPLRARPQFSLSRGAMLAITVGTGIVIATTKEHLDWARKTYLGVERDMVFAPTHIAQAVQYWAVHGQRVRGPSPIFTGSSGTVRRFPPPVGYVIKMIGRDQTGRLDRSVFPFAMDPVPSAERPEVFAVCAYLASGPKTETDLLRPIGVAVVTANLDSLWEIGIQVADGHQGRRLGSALGSIAASETLLHGRVPYWAAATSNIFSQRTALSVGLVLTAAREWTELSA